jgi:hypothetical protein
MASTTLAPAFATRRGKDLIVPRSASLPANCLKCGNPASIPWRKKFYWHPQWLYLMILFPGIIIYAIVALIIRKQMELNLPLCDRHHADRKRYRRLGWLMLAGFLPLGLILGAYISEPLGWVTGVGMFLASMVFLVLSNLRIAPTKIDDAGGVFRGACDTFLNALPEQP